jgi:arylsulfatase A-like enzyme
MLKPLGYATGQFGKNHFGDLNKYLPTAHGFDEFFGNLYHLNAEEEPENVDYPPEEDFPQFHARFKPRGVMHSWATDVDDPTEEPRWGRVGKQKIEDTGPLTKKRMETVDTEFCPRQAISSKMRMDTTNLSLFGSTPPGCISGSTRPRRSWARPGAGSRTITM